MDFDMGKYAFFVWTAYGLSALSLCALVILSLVARNDKLKTLTELQTTLDNTQKKQP